MLEDVVEADRLGVFDQDSENAATFGEVPDELTSTFIDPLIDELDQVVLLATYAHRPVAGVHQVDSRMDDGPQRVVELETRSDHQHGVDQTVEPVSAFDDLLDAVLDLDEQLAQSQLRQRVAYRTHARINPRTDLIGHATIVAPAVNIGNVSVRLNRRGGAPDPAVWRRPPPECGAPSPVWPAAAIHSSSPSSRRGTSVRQFVCW